MKTVTLEKFAFLHELCFQNGELVDGSEKHAFYLDVEGPIDDCVMIGRATITIKLQDDFRGQQLAALNAQILTVMAGSERAITGIKTKINNLLAITNEATQ